MWGVKGNVAGSRTLGTGSLRFFYAVLMAFVAGRW